MKKNILFTGGGGSAASPLIEQWGKQYNLWFADADPNAFPTTVPMERRVIIPFAKEDGFSTAVKTACIDNEIDLLVPGVDEELSKLAAHHGDDGWPHILLPSQQFVELMLDKRSSANALRENGLDVPKTLPLTQADQIGFPLIAKPRSGRGSRGVMVLERTEQVSAYIGLYGGNADDFIAQELGTGKEYTVLVAADDQQRLRAVIPVHALEKRGITVRAQTDCPPSIIEYAKQFQEVFKQSGIYNIQCMLTEDGRVLPFEVNPRISTTFVLGTASGFDPISMIFDADWDGEIYTPSQQWFLHRSWQTDIWSKE